MLFKVKKLKDGTMRVQMKANDFIKMAIGLGKYVPIQDLINDDEYLIRFNSDGVLELGYYEDKWKID